MDRIQGRVEGRSAPLTRSETCLRPDSRSPGDLIGRGSELLAGVLRTSDSGPTLQPVA